MQHFINNARVSCVNASERAVKAAQSALSWRESSIEQRRDVFNNAARILHKRKDEVIQTMSSETTTTKDYAEFNFYGAIGIFKELAASVGHATRGEIIPYEGGVAELHRRPYGVCLAMAPWNAPLILACRALATPIVAGNTVVLKSSERTPETHAVFGELMRDAGLPDGVLNIIHVNEDIPATVERMIADERVRHVNFTGSTKVGSIIGELCGRHIKPAVMELGGKASAIVLPDADLSLAASHCAIGARMHAGQICMSTERIIVHTDVYDRFIEMFEEMDNIEHELVSDAISKGATIKSNMLMNVTPDMRVYYEESFLPIAVVIRADSDDHAVAIANDSDYALSSAVFSSPDRAHAIALRLDAAATHINSMTVFDNAAVPHGGSKRSGYGRFNGMEGIRSFLQTKVITGR